MIKAWWIIAFWILPLFLFGQLKKDRKSEEFYTKGVSLFTEQNYSTAAKQFALIKDRPFNRVYTAGLYMQALSLYFAEDYDKALSKFQNLINTYPESSFIDQATYHKSLIMLKRAETRLGGLYLLAKLSDETTSEDLRLSADDAFKSFLYKDADLKFVKEYYDFIGEKHSKRSFVLEVLCYKLWEAKEYDEIPKVITEFQKQGGTPTPNLKIWKVPIIKEKKKNPKYRIAAILPFQAGTGVKELNIVSSWSVEILEGMQLAVLMHEEPLPVDIVIKAFDSNNNVKTTENLLSGEVKTFRPDLIIGDIANNPTMIISKYAEESNIPHFVPVSPKDELKDGKNYVWLANSSMTTQMTGLAGYASEKLNLKKIMIIGDNTPLSEVQIPVFKSVCEKNGSKVSVIRLPSDIDNDKWYLKSQAEDIAEKKYEGIFISSNNQAVISKLLTGLKSQKANVYIFGSTDWGKFKEVDPGLLSHFKSTFSDGYWPENDSAGFARFSKQYTETFKQVPSRYACLGYDILSYIIHLRKNNAPDVPLKEAIRNAKPYKGLIQNYYYSSGKDNQSIQILTYRNGKIEKVKLW